MTMNISDEHLNTFIAEQGLPASYREQAQKWFNLVINKISKHQKSANKPLIIGICGSQGSGKTTLASYIQFIFEQHAIPVCSISLDDFYLGHDDRQTLAQKIHPLLATRGVPGTHDIELALRTLHNLQFNNYQVDNSQLHSSNKLVIPRFDKSTDDRLPESQWDCLTQPPKVIILEGWCLGIPAENEDELMTAINTLESEEDPKGTWRKYVNQTLSKEYKELWNAPDYLIYLQAPSFDCVYDWRLEQEQKLKEQKLQKQKLKDTNANVKGIMSEQQISRFIQHYQRLTEHGLDSMPNVADIVLVQDENRKIISMQDSEGTIEYNSPLIFSDLDGSLLDHFTYSSEPADALLEQLDSDNIPVIFTSSKTRAEIEFLRDSMNNPHPFICENGAAVCIPKNYFPSPTLASSIEGCKETDLYYIKEFSRPFSHWQKILDDLPHYIVRDFKRFSEMTMIDVVQATGLSPSEATLAAQREYGEPLLWKGDKEHKLRFIELMQVHGAHLSYGGRFLHLGDSTSKGQALNWLKEVYQQQFKKDFSTIALGDGQNDIEMLEASDMAVMVRSPINPPLEIQHTNSISSQEFGPKGWVEGVQYFLQQMEA